MATRTDKKPTVVIGAGVVGTAIALELARRGRTVTLVDRDAPGMGCSYGNLAGIAGTEVVPQAVRSTFRQVPRWLLDPLGPLTVRWSDLPHLAPWFWHFFRSSHPATVEATADALARILTRAMPDTESLLARLGCSHLLTDKDCLSLYDTPREIAGAQDGFDLRARHGFPCQRVTTDELREMEPELSPALAGGWVYKGWRNLTSPLALTEAMIGAFTQAGGTVRRDRATGLEHDGASVQAVAFEGGERFKAGEVVIAAGAWSAELARMLGDRVSLTAERGYHTMITDPGITPRHSIIHGGQGFGITPLSEGLRIGGTVELCHPDTEPNYKRAKVLIAKAKKVFPGLNSFEGEEWSGCRPSTPDSKPVLGRASRMSNVFYAFGHGHLGLTMGATTAQLIADQMTNAASNFDFAPFRAGRF